jgi:hypothetical protein
VSLVSPDDAAFAVSGQRHCGSFTHGSDLIDGAHSRAIPDPPSRRMRRISESLKRLILNQDDRRVQRIAALSRRRERQQMAIGVEQPHPLRQ